MNISDTIRDIVAQAEKANADPVLWVQDYLSEKNDRLIGRRYADRMIALHCARGGLVPPMTLTCPKLD